MSTGYLFDSYIFFCNIMKKGPYERRSQRALSDYLVKCGFALARNSARTQRGFNMLDVPQASALFCEKLGIENIHTPDTYKTVSGSVSGSKALQIKGLDTSDTVDTVLK
jgi:hypothetical protein